MPTPHGADALPSIARSKVIMRRVFEVAVIASVLTTGVAQAANSANPQLGLAYARESCAECHAVEMGEAVSPSPDAPSFEFVANRPDVTAQSLDVWLQSPHPTMPNFMIPTQDRNNVISYILNLRTKK